MTYIVPIKNSIEATYNNSIYTVAYFNDIISTTALDKANTDWDDVTTWAKDSWIRIPDLKRVYRCAAETSLNQYPPANPSVWIDYGAVNSYKMFDDIIGSQTEFDTTATVVISSNKINSLAFLNMDNISSIRVVQTDLDTLEVFHDVTYDLSEYGVLSLYDYWYKAVKYRRDLVIQDMYYLINAKIEITFTCNGVGKIGAVISGLADNIGITLYGTKIELRDYSKYRVDDYGNTSFSKRGYARIITAQSLIDTNQIDDISSKLVELRGSITLFVGDEREDGFSSLTTLGYIENIAFQLDNPSKTKYPIKIIGVI